MKPKKSIFSKIFGLSNKTNVKNIPEVSESDDTTEFKNEIKEIFEENKKEDSQLDFEENDRFWFDFLTLKEIAYSVGFKKCERISIPNKLFQSSHMFDFILYK